MVQNLAHIAQNQGDFEQAKSLFVEALMTSVELSHKCSIANCLIGLAGVIGIFGQPKRAARLFGAAEAIRERIDAHIQPGDCLDYERNLAATHAQLDDATFQSAWLEGRMMTLE